MSRVLVVLFSLVFCIAANAAPPSDASLERLFSLTQVQKNLDAMLLNIEPQLQRSMGQDETEKMSVLMQKTMLLTTDSLQPMMKKNRTRNRKIRHATDV
jgi:hypothetical protein